MPTHETEPARLYDILRHCLDTAGVMFVDDGSGTPLSPACAGRRCCGCATTPVRLRRATPARAPPRRRSSPSSTPTSTSMPDGSTGCCGTSTIRTSGYVAPRVASGPAVGGGDARVAKYEERHSPLDLGAEPAAHRPGDPRRLRPRRRPARAQGGTRRDRRFRRCAALRRGRRRRLEAARRRMARPLRAGRRRAPPAAADLAGPGRAAPRLRRVGSVAGVGARQCRRPGADERVEPRRVGPRRRRAAVLGDRNGGRDGAGADPQAARRAGERVAAARRPRPPRRRPIAGDGVAADVVAARRRRRAVVAASAAGSLPRAVVPALFEGGPARLFDDVSYGVGVWKGVLGRRRLAAGASRRRLLATARRSSSRWCVAACCGAGQRLDAPPHGRHGSVARPTSGASPPRTRRSCPWSRATATGSAGRRWPASPRSSSRRGGPGRTNLGLGGAQKTLSRRRSPSERSTSSPACRRGCDRSCSRRR